MSIVRLPKAPKSHQMPSSFGCLAFPRASSRGQPKSLKESSWEARRFPPFPLPSLYTPTPPPEPWDCTNLDLCRQNRSDLNVNWNLDADHWP